MFGLNPAVWFLWPRRVVTGGGFRIITPPRRNRHRTSAHHLNVFNLQADGVRYPSSRPWSSSRSGFSFLLPLAFFRLMAGSALSLGVGGLVGSGRVPPREPVPAWRPGPRSTRPPLGGLEVRQQALARDLRVPLGNRQVGVAANGLDRPHVRTRFKQARCARVMKPAARGGGSRQRMEASRVSAAG